jgi:hypothetical protein
MRAVSKDGFRSLLYLISLLVGVATLGILVGVGFLWLTDPRPAAQVGGTILSAQALGGGEPTSRRAVQLGGTGVGDASDEGKTHPVRRNHPGQKGAGRNSEILGGLVATRCQRRTKPRRRLLRSSKQQCRVHKPEVGPHRRPLDCEISHVRLKLR